MKEMISYCGVECTKCPQYIATQKNDDVLREKAAIRLEKEFGLHFDAKEINCDGCNTCEVRKCGAEKVIKNCTVCEEQPCDKLRRIHEFIPNAKASFDNLLKKRK